MLTREKKPGESIAVIMVKIDSRDGSPDVPKDIMEGFRMLLQESLRSDTDVLLPNMDSDSEQKSLFVVAQTEQRGAEIIGRRILRQLRSLEEFPANDFSFTISHSFLPPIARAATESMETFVEHVAAEVQANISHACLREKSSYGPKENSCCR
jgi:hypothetical protein